MSPLFPYTPASPSLPILHLCNRLTFSSLCPQPPSFSSDPCIRCFLTAGPPGRPATQDQQRAGQGAGDAGGDDVLVRPGDAQPGHAAPAARGGGGAAGQGGRGGGGGVGKVMNMRDSLEWRARELRRHNNSINLLDEISHMDHTARRVTWLHGHVWGSGTRAKARKPSRNGGRGRCVQCVTSVTGVDCGDH